MPSGATYPAERHMKIEDSWIVANSSNVDSQIFCEFEDGVDHRKDGTAIRVGMPRGIMIRGDATTDGNAAFVRGVLWDEQHLNADDFYLTAGIMHPMRFRRIYAQGTTARGIKIFY